MTATRPAQTGTIGLALSGGGFRATVFSLGVLFYFVDRHINNRISYVASVFGGWVANAYVAQECDLNTVTVDEFSLTGGDLQ